MGLINYSKVLLGGSGSGETQSSDVDPDHVLHAMKFIESGGDYSAKEAGGAGPGRGAYQFTGTWPSWSREYARSMGLPERILPMTEENQDAVARFKVKQFIDEGLNPRQIAAKWNSGGPDYFGKRGVNKYGQSYNVARHVEKFQTAYDKLADLFAPASAEAAEMDYSKVLLGGGGWASTAKPKETKINYADILLGGKGDSIQAPTETQIKSEQTPGAPQAAHHQPASFRSRVKAAFVDKPESMLKVFAEERFPNLSPEQREAKYFMKDGEFYYVDTEPGSNVQKIFKETGEGLGDTAKSYLAQIVGKAPSIIGGGIGAVTGGVPAMLGLTAGGELFRQGVGGTVGEEKTWPDVAKEVGKETLAAAAGLGLGKAAEPVINLAGRAGAGKIGRLAASDYRSLNPQEMQRLFALGERYGIPLTVPEATGSPSLINAFNLASTSPYQVSERIMQWAETQRVPQIKEAIARELDAIFPNESIFEAGRAGQRAATEGLGVLKESRKAMAGPWYEAARQSDVKVDIQPVLAKIDELQAQAPRGWKVDNLLTRMKKGLTTERETVPDSAMPGRDEMKSIIRDVYANIDQVRRVGISTQSIRADYGPEGVRAINRAIPGVIRKNGQPLDQVAAYYGFKSGDALFGALSDYQPRYKMMALTEKQRATREVVPVDDIKVLHGAKLEIDSLLKGPEAEGLTNDIKRQLMQIKESLVSQMEAASPEYARGMEEFRRGSKLVNDFMYGQWEIDPSNPPPLSTLGRIVKKKQGETVEDIPGMLFGKGSSPAIVKQAKRFIEGQDPDAWKALVRAHLQDRLETAVKNSQGWGYGHKFKETVFGTMRQQAILREALTNPITGDTSAYRRFSDFMDLLDVTNRIVYRNSRTTPLAVTKEMIEREAGGLRGRLIEIAGSKLNWTKWADINRRLSAPEYLDRIYDAMMDPSTGQTLGRIRQLSNPQKKAIETVAVVSAILGENVTDYQIDMSLDLYPERAESAKR